MANENRVLKLHPRRQDEEQDRLFHEQRPAPVACACGAVIQPRRVPWLEGETRWALPGQCDACADRAEREWLAREKAELLRDLRKASRLPAAARGASLASLDPAYMDRQGRGVEAVRRWRYEPSPAPGADPWRTWRAPYLWSACGLGKTTLAYILANRVMEKLERPVLFVSVADLLRRQRATFRSGEGTDLVDRALSVFFLVLDDLGGQSMTPWVLESLYVVLDERLKDRRPTCITSNYDPASLAQVLIPRGREGEDLAPTARALADRAIELCIPIRLGDERGEGESIRLDQAAARQEALFA